MNRNVTALKIILWIVFGIVMVVGLAIFFGGAAIYPGISEVSPALDSEIRFFAAFWLGYGWLVWWTNSNLEKRHQFVPILVFLMLLGAGGRVLSWLMVGRPIDAMVTALGVEVVMGVVTAVFYRRFLQNQQPSS